MYLFMKIDTSGLIRRELELHDKQQPWAVKVAFDHTDKVGNTFNRAEFLIKADERSIKPGAIEVHGITLRTSEQFGIKENSVLIQLQEVAGLSQLAITYAAFDNMVIDSLLMRLEDKLQKNRGVYLNKWRRPGLSFLTIQDPVAKTECELPHEEKPDELRSPKLDEACELLLGEPLPEKPLDTFSNLERTKRLFFHLKDMGHFGELLAS